MSRSLGIEHGGKGAVVQRTVSSYSRLALSGAMLVWVCLLFTAPPAGAHGRLHHCRSPLVYAPKSGGYGLILDDLQVARVACRRAVKIGGAYTAGEPMPTGWHCAFSKSDSRTRCGFKRSRRRFSFLFEGDAG
jgi:hypothetical protein